MKDKIQEVAQAMVAGAMIIQHIARDDGTGLHIDRPSDIWKMMSATSKPFWLAKAKAYLEALAAEEQGT